MAVVLAAVAFLVGPRAEASSGDLAGTMPVGAQGLAPLQPEGVGAVVGSEHLAVFYGVIQPAAGEPLPIRVRALGADGAVCGTSDVAPATTGDAGAYAMAVYSSEAKAGCPAPGEVVRFVLLYDSLDPGVPAAQTATWASGRHALNLSRADEPAVQGRFLGEVPGGSGYALLSWSGPATRIEVALATLPRAVEAVYHIESFAIRRYVPGAPAFVSDYLQVSPGDIVIVRFP